MRSMLLALWLAWWWPFEKTEVLFVCSRRSDFADIPVLTDGVVAGPRKDSLMYAAASGFSLQLAPATQQ